MSDGLEQTEEGPDATTPGGPQDPDERTPPVPRGDLEGALAARSSRQGRRPVTLVLAAVVILGLGFLLGGFVQRHASGGTTPAAAVGPGGSQGFPVAGGPGGGTDGSLTPGTVERVDGDTVYVKEADGTIVKVDTDSGTTVTLSRKGSVSDLRPGQSVLVIGTEGSNDSVDASQITEGDLAARGPVGFPGPAATTGSSG